MGACLCTRHYKSWKEAKEAWPRDVDESLYENGRSYSGDIGMLGPSLPATPNHQIAKGTPEEAESEAYEWLADNQDKWSPAKVVGLPDGSVVVGGWCSS